METSINIRKANENDLVLYFDWANDKTVRNNAISTKSISFSEHQRWFFEKLQNPSTFMYLFNIDDAPFGQVRFDIEDMKTFIDYSVKKSFRGKGLGFSMLQLGIKTFIKDIESILVQEIIGVVKTTNLPSCRVFEKLNFEVSKENNNYKTFSMPLKL